MKLKTALLAVILGSSAALAACGGENTAEEPSETAVSAGEEVYQQNCLQCHGENLEGAYGPALDKVGAEYSEEEILHVIQKGQGQMPANIVKGEDAEAVAAWLAKKK